jgi:monovalent cation:H+ antiporter-2, CPA2 family
VAQTGSEELFLLVALAIALGTAAVTQAAGLSLALGAFRGGLIISQSDHAHDAPARLLPVRDAFVALFFVTVGTLINPVAVVGSPGLLATLLGLVVLGKFVIWTAVVRVFAYPLATAALVGVGLTQIGEFSFILVQVARQAAGRRRHLPRHPRHLAADDPDQRGPGPLRPRRAPGPPGAAARDGLTSLRRPPGGSD